MVEAFLLYTSLVPTLNNSKKKNECFAGKSWIVLTI